MVWNRLSILIKGQYSLNFFFFFFFWCVNVKELYLGTCILKELYVWKIYVNFKEWFWYLNKPSLWILMESVGIREGDRYEKVMHVFFFLEEIWFYWRFLKFTILLLPFWRKALPSFEETWNLRCFESRLVDTGPGIVHILLDIHFIHKFPAKGLRYLLFAKRNTFFIIPRGGCQKIHIKWIWACIILSMVISYFIRAVLTNLSIFLGGHSTLKGHEPPLNENVKRK
jgi:hypothetical protein